MPKWNRTDERVPEYVGYFWIAKRPGVVEMAFWDNNEWEREGVTHWIEMEEPELPNDYEL